MNIIRSDSSDAFFCLDKVLSFSDDKNQSNTLFFLSQI
jgi:hypothetical protein